MELTKEHILEAIERINSDSSLLKGRESTNYDLVYKGATYPPILVLSIANQINGGEQITIRHFNNNVNTAFKILKDLDFEVVPKVKDNRNDFELWLKANSPENSGTTSAYIISLDYLSNIFYSKKKIAVASIFYINDLSEIDILYKEVLQIQKDRTSYLFNKDAPSYGDKGFYSASLKKYMQFIDHAKKVELRSEVNKNFEVNEFGEMCKISGLIFSLSLIQRFIASLCTKPFVICSGLSGSGKTKLAQAFAQWISADKSQYLIVPVGADWTNREPLLGYPNALDKEEYVSPENGVLDLMIRAKQNFENTEEPTKPYFLILDEMNLSHVERYFADFLSTMESGDSIPLHNIQNNNAVIPHSIELPKNLFIIGTVNIDETTYMFSPKVLDRANTIEFRLTEKDLEKFISSDVKLNMNMLIAQGANMGESFMAMALQETDKNLKSSEADLRLFFSELKKSGAEFGYRTASEIGRLMHMLQELGESGDNLFDIAIMQKLLPKLHGSRNKLTKVLTTLGSFCLHNQSKIKEDYLDKFVSNTLSENEISSDTNIKYKISFEKICRMYKNAVENGFASYAEA